MFSNTFAGIAPSSVPSFVAAQVVGGLVALGVILVLYPLALSGRGGRHPRPPCRPDRRAVGCPDVTTELPEVLFLCVHNAGRSQMAAAGLLARYGR